jgi:hypothetical protein
MRDVLSRRIARLEQRAAARSPGACTVRHLQTSPEEQEAVLAILLEVGALRLAEDGTPLCCAEGGWVPWSH